MRLFTTIVFLISSLGLMSQGATCAAADPFCTGTAEVFPNTTGGDDAELGPDYGCLGSEPNPAWYFMQIGTSGDIELTMSQETTGGTGLDVDFICWGPFGDLNGACANLTSGNTIDCSYSTSAVEICYIPNGVAGEFYLVLITNFSDAPGTIDFDQTGGTGETDCNVLDPCTANAGLDAGFCAGGAAPLGGAPTASGGTSVFTYSWAPTAGLDDPTSSNPIATPAATTTYTVTVDDGGGCVVTDQVTITVFPDPVVNPGPDLVLDCLASEVTLNGSASSAGASTWSTVDGNIVSGGTTLSPVVNQQGIYTLEIISVDGCAGTSDVAVGLAPILDAEATISGAELMCAGESTDMTVTVDLTGNWEMTYSIDGIPQPAVSFTGTSYVINAILEGEYEIMFINNPLCTVDPDGSVELYVEPLPSANFPLAEVQLCPGETEIVQVDLTGDGTIYLDWSIDGVGQTQVSGSTGTVDITVDQAGEYNPVTVFTDNCVGNTFGNFDAVDLPNPTATFQDDYTICDDEVATVIIDLTGNQPYEYNYSVNGVLQGLSTEFSDQIILNIAEPGAVVITSLSDQYCVGAPTNSSTVTVNPLPEATISGGDTYCSNALVDLDIDLVGTGPFTIDYTLNGVLQTPIISTDLSTVLQTMTPGTFAITQVSDSLCDDGPMNFTTIEHYPPISTSILAPSEVCFDDTIPFTAQPTGGQGSTYTYLWTDNNGAEYTTNPIELLMLDDLTLTLVVNDICDLPDADNVSFTEVQEYPTPSFTASIDSVCIGEEVDFVRTSIDESVDCSWEFESGPLVSGCDEVAHSFFTSGYQTVTLSSSTSAGCTTSTTVDSVLYINPNAVADFIFEMVEGTIFSPGVEFTNLTSDGVEYLWEFGDGELDTDYSPLHNFPAAISEFYVTCLTSFNAVGCADTACKIIFIEPEFLMSIPNAFTPDRDGLNDQFVPVFNDIQLEEYSLRIFNRIGEIIFESFEQGQSWTGAGREDGEFYAGNEIYFYHVTAREANRTEKREFFGQVTVIR